MTVGLGYNFSYQPYGTFSVPKLTIRSEDGKEITFEGHKAYAAHTMIVVVPSNLRQDVMDLIWKQNYVDPERFSGSGPGSMVTAFDIPTAEQHNGIPIGADQPGL